MNKLDITVTCPLCGKKSTISVFEDDYRQYKYGGLAQECFPYLNVGEREMLISGICPTCWDLMFSE